MQQINFTIFKPLKINLFNILIRVIQKVFKTIKINKKKTINGYFTESYLLINPLNIIHNRN